MSAPGKKCQPIRIRFRDLDGRKKRKGAKERKRIRAIQAKPGRRHPRGGSADPTPTGPFRQLSTLRPASVAKPTEAAILDQYLALPRPEKDGGGARMARLKSLARIHRLTRGKTTAPEAHGRRTRRRRERQPKAVSLANRLPPRIPRIRSVRPLTGTRRIRSRMTYSLIVRQQLQDFG